MKNMQAVRIPTYGGPEVVKYEEAALLIIPMMNSNNAYQINDQGRLL